MPEERRLSGWYDDLLAGDVDALLARLTMIPALDSPLSGAVDGADAVRAYVESEGATLRQLVERIEVTAAFGDAAADVLEIVAWCRRGEERFDLPIVLIGARAGARYGQVRIYHSTWPLSGRHRVRAPIAYPRGVLDEPPIIRTYFDAIAAGDAARVLATFAPDGYVREPSGTQFLHRGPDGRAAFYAAAFAQPGGVPLLHANAVFDGTRFAVEYVCDRWGTARFRPMAGCAVYELAGGGTELTAVRIYDDVSPPSEDA